MLVDGEVVHLNQTMLQDHVQVLSRRSEQVRDALNGALIEGLDHMVVLGEGGCDAPGTELGLHLGEPAANPGPQELGELDGDSIDRVDGVEGLGDDGVVDIDVGVMESGPTTNLARAGSQRARGCNHRARRRRNKVAKTYFVLQGKLSPVSITKTAIIV